MRAESVNFQASDAGWQEAWEPCKDYQRELWASCSQIPPTVLRSHLETYKPARFTAQVENGNEAADLRRFVDLGVFEGHVLDVVVIGQDFDASKGEPLSLGAQRTWFEAYLEDGRLPSAINDQIIPWWTTYPNPRPLIGCYHGIPPSSYDLAPFGRNYGVWLWELCQPEWFAMMP